MTGRPSARQPLRRFEGSVKELIATRPALSPELLERIRDLLRPLDTLAHNGSIRAEADCTPHRAAPSAPDPLPGNDPVATGE